MDYYSFDDPGMMEGWLPDSGQFTHNHISVAIQRKSAGQILTS